MDYYQPIQSILAGTIPYLLPSPTKSYKSQVNVLSVLIHALKSEHEIVPLDNSCD